MADYCTVAELKSSARLDFESTDAARDATLGEMVTAASRWIDAETWGIVDAFKATATTTLYYGRGAVEGQVLTLSQPILSVSSLTNGDGTVLSSGQYRLHPRNETPYWQIRLMSTAGWAFSADGEIEVAGVVGYSATVPDQVREACLMLSGWIFKRWERALADAEASPELGEIIYGASFPKAVRELLRAVSQGVKL